MGGGELDLEEHYDIVKRNGEHPMMPRKYYDAIKYWCGACHIGCDSKCGITQEECIQMHSQKIVCRIFYWEIYKKYIKEEMKSND